MSDIGHIHADKEPIRIHFIAEWMEARNLRAVDVAREIGADKSLVSRWINEAKVPGQNYLEQLAALFGTDIHGLFRHPDDDWLTRFFHKRNEEERDRMIALLKAAFPDLKTGTDN